MRADRDYGGAARLAPRHGCQPGLRGDEGPQGRERAPGHTNSRMLDTVYLKLYDEASHKVADAIDEIIRTSLARETDH